MAGETRGVKENQGAGRSIRPAAANGLGGGDNEPVHAHEEDENKP